MIINNILITILVQLKTVFQDRKFIGAQFGELEKCI